MSQSSDIDRWSFPVKDLTRRKFQTALTVLSLAVCVSVTVFLVLFAESLGVEVLSFAGGSLTVGFSTIFSTFIIVVVILNSITGVIVAYFLISLATSERVRDVGIMKAVGCLTDVVFSYFSTELLIIVSVGCAIGTGGGIILTATSISLMNYMGFHVSTRLPDPLLIILILFSFAFISYILGMRRIIKASDVEPAKALSPLFICKTGHQPVFKLRLFRRGNFTANIALRELVRRRSTTLQSLVCLSVVMASMTLAVIGGIVANETTQSFVERAIGRDIILVAEAEMAEHYVSLLNSFEEKGQTGVIDYLDEKYVIPNSLILTLTIDGVVKVDPRLVLETTVHEYQTIIPNPDEPTRYVVIGDNRFSEATIVGVHPDRLVNDWLIYGEGLNESEPDSVLLGDSLALAIFQKPLVQSLGILNSEFKVAGVCLDPLNNGNVVYMSFSRLSHIVNYAGYNLLLLQVDPDPSIRSQVLSQIGSHIYGTGLVMLDLNQVLGRHRAFLNYIWSMMLSLSLLTFVNAIISLVGYLMLSISGHMKDLGIMRALGTKPKTVVKLILFETFLLVLGGGVIGLPIGIAIAFWFFIPEAVISQTAILTIVALLSILMGALCLSSLYPARKIVGTPITMATNQT